MPAARAQSVPKNIQVPQLNSFGIGGCGDPRRRRYRCGSGRAVSLLLTQFLIFFMARPLSDSEGALFGESQIQRNPRQIVPGWQLIW
jgi:hypothetical protein